MPLLPLEQGHSNYMNNLQRTEEKNIPFADFSLRPRRSLVAVVTMSNAPIRQGEYMYKRSSYMYG